MRGAEQLLEAGDVALDGLQLVTELVQLPLNLGAQFAPLLIV
jgi:hypothetical protein